MTAKKPRKPPKAPKKAPAPQTDPAKGETENTDHLDASTRDASQPLENARYELFCQNLAMYGMPQGRAYRLAGFAVETDDIGSAAANRLLKDVKVQTRVTFLKARAAALAIDHAALTRGSIINMLLEQHQRNIGVRPVIMSQRIKTGKDKGKYETVEKIVYNEHAASQTLKLLSDEWGVGLGASAANGALQDDEATGMTREALADAQARTLKHIEAVKRTRVAALELSKTK